MTENPLWCPTKCHRDQGRIGYYLFNLVRVIRERSSTVATSLVWFNNKVFSLPLCPSTVHPFFLSQKYIFPSLFSLVELGTRQFGKWNKYLGISWMRLAPIRGPLCGALFTMGIKELFSTLFLSFVLRLRYTIETRMFQGLSVRWCVCFDYTLGKASSVQLSTRFKGPRKYPGPHKINPLFMDVTERAD